MEIERRFLEQLGGRAVELILEGVEEGRDILGRPYAYSTRPFARPAGPVGINQTQWGRLERKTKRRSSSAGEDPEVEYFTSKKSGKPWVRIEGGYKRFKEIIFERPGGGPFLEATGSMLRNLNVTRVAGDADVPSVTLGFTDPEDAQKAFWLNVAGAGKRRTLWRFLGLREDQQRALAAWAAGRLAPDVQAALAETLRGTLSLPERP